MKKMFLALTITTFLLVACGDNNSKKTKETKIEQQKTPKKKEVKTIAQRKKEGKVVRTELSKYITNIPESLVFKEAIMNNAGIKKSVFFAENVDEEQKMKLDSWVLDQIKKLENDSWEKLLLQDNVVISGMTYNTYSFKKAQGAESSIVDMLSLTSVYSPDKKSYTIFVKPYTL